MRIVHVGTAVASAVTSADASADATLDVEPGPRRRAALAALAELAAAYAAAGHQLVTVVPGARDRLEDVGAARLVTLAAPRLPGPAGLAGRRVLLDRPAVREVLTRVRPERIEVSDRMSCWLGREARRRGIDSLAICSESWDALLRAHLALALPTRAVRAVTDAVNRRVAASFDAVVCTSAAASAELARIGAAHVLQLPHEGDGAASRPVAAGHVVRRAPLAGAPVLLPGG